VTILRGALRPDDLQILLSVRRGSRFAEKKGFETAAFRGTMRVRLRLVRGVNEC